MGCAPHSLPRDSFCSQQLPLLAQISLKLARPINYSPGIEGTSSDLLPGYFQHELRTAMNKLMGSQSNTPTSGSSQENFRKTFISVILHKNRSRTLATLWHLGLSENCPPATAFPPELICGGFFGSFPPGKDHPGPGRKGSTPGKGKIREITF